MSESPAIPLPSGLPTSSQLRRVGSRFVKGMATDEDQAALGQYLRAADDLQNAVVGVLSDSTYRVFSHATRGLRVYFDDPPSDSLHVRGRAKTENTLIDKLRRMKSFPLGAIRDVAGVRVVMDCNLFHQDGLVTVVTEVLKRALSTDEPKLIDRRSDPMSGYRAVHLEFQAGGLPLEVQVRTHLQHLWAEMYERLADVAGRQIRYGEPAPPEWTQWVDSAIRLSHSIRRLEDMDRIPHEAGLEMLRQELPPDAWEALNALGARRELLDEIRQDLLGILQQLTDATPTP